MRLGVFQGVPEIERDEMMAYKKLVQGEREECKEPMVFAMSSALQVCSGLLPEPS